MTLNSSTAVAAAVSLAAQQQHDAAVQEGRRKFASHLDDHVLDYLHNNAIHIEACLSTCAKIFGNVLQQPDEDKYRRIKAMSNALRNAVQNVKGGEDLLLHAGWVPKARRPCRRVA